MSLSGLPREIVLIIANYLSDTGINTLASTNSQVYNFLNNHLYRGDVTRPRSKSLHWAAELGVEGTIKQAIYAGGHFNPIPQSFHTALQLAAYYGHVHGVELLLKVENINLNYRGGLFKSTPLGCAAKRGHSAIVQLLLATDNVDPNVGDESSLTPLYWACEMGHVSIVRQLLARDDISIGAIRYGLRSKSLLTVACMEGHVEIINLLLAQDGIDVNFQDDGDTPLMLAINRRLVKVVKSLLARDDVNPNIICRGTHVLEAAVVLGDVGIVKLLLDHPDIDPNFSTGSCSVLMCADDPDVARLLLDHESIHVNYQDRGGWTALGRAVSFSNFEVAKLLLERQDIDINLANDKGETPLFWACTNGYLELVELLLKKDNIDPNVRENCQGRTPLANVCHYYNLICNRMHAVAIVRLLLSHPDTDPNPVDNDGVMLLDYIQQLQQCYDDIDVINDIKSLLFTAVLELR